MELFLSKVIINCHVHLFRAFKERNISYLSLKAISYKLTILLKLSVFLRYSM
jgi:hypothetical protein